uniref:Uncharacterized protein n=1 Tax=Arundo donax TaxID=35708 RepID=A0A0A9EB54_ARUDO
MSQRNELDWSLGWRVQSLHGMAVWPGLGWGHGRGGRVRWSLDARCRPPVPCVSRAPADRRRWPTRQPHSWAWSWTAAAADCGSPVSTCFGKAAPILKPVAGKSDTSIPVGLLLLLFLVCLS